MKLDEAAELLDLIPLPALVIEPAGRVLAHNRAARDVFGGEPLLGMLVESLQLLKAMGQASHLRVGGSAEKALLHRSHELGRAALASAREIQLDGGPAILVLIQEANVHAVAEPGRERTAEETAVRLHRIGLFEHDHRTGSSSASPILRDICGLAPGEPFTFDLLRNMFVEEDRASFDAALARASDPGGTGESDGIYRLERRDGARRWILVRSQTSFDGAGDRRAPLKTLGSLRDVSEHMEKTLALERSEQRLAHATSTLGIGVFEHEHPASGGAPEPYWSPALRAMLGFDPEAAPDLSWYLSRMAPEDVTRYHTAIARALDAEADGAIDLQYRWSHPDGRDRWLHIRSATEFTQVEGQRRPQRSVGAMVDVTERRAADGELLRRSAILDATPDFVCITDEKGSILFLNKAARDFLGLAAGEEIGDRNMAPLHPERSARLILDEGIPTALRDGYWKGEVEFIRHDGRIVPMSQVLLSHRGDDGRVAYLSTVSRDLSRQKELEEQFRQAQKMEAIGRLAGGVAHDFNNLLSAILGFTSMALEDLEPGHEARSGLEQVLRAAERAAALTAQLLAFGRKQILQPRVLDLNQCVLETSAIVRRLVGENIRVTLLQAARPVQTRADPNQIQQALLNLVVNARDAMQGGGLLTIETRLAELDDPEAAASLELSPGQYGVISVSDTGHGMDGTTRARAFEPFFTTKAAGEGTGLGLSTVFGIVRQSGGGVSLSSEPGRGTTFDLYFPSTDEAVTHSIPSIAAPKPVPSAVVLVAEDDAQARSMVTTVLSRAGYRVLAASDPMEALELASAHAGSIDLLLTDVLMPGMNGRELARRLLANRPAMSVLYVSGYTEDSIVHRGVLDPGVEFLAKPLTPNALLRTVEEVLARRTTPP